MDSDTPAVPRRRRRDGTPRPRVSDQRRQSAAQHGVGGGQERGDRDAGGGLAARGRPQAGHVSPIEEPPSSLLWRVRQHLGCMHIVVFLIVSFFGWTALAVYRITHPVFADFDASGRQIVKHGCVFKSGDALHAKLWINSRAAVPRHAPFAEFDLTYSWDAFGSKPQHVNISIPQDALMNSRNTSLIVEVLHKASGRSVTAHGRVLKSLPEPEAQVRYSLVSGSVCPVDFEPSFEHQRVVRGIPVMQVQLVYDTTRYPEHVTPTSYVPRLFVDEFGMTPDALVRLNTTGKNAYELEVRLNLMSSARRNFQRHMEFTLTQQASLWGENSEEMKQVRDLFANTNPVLLAVTMVVSVLHIIFDFLAFKNDVLFWKSCDSETLNKYMSVKSILGTIVSQFFLLLYLVDEGANVLLVGLSAVSIVIDIWKVQRVMVIHITYVYGCPFPVLDSKVHKEKKEDFDSIAMNWLMIILSPFIVGYSMYTLLVHCHRGWWSYFLTVSASCVYSLGFVWMTPQIFINYKHKTVAYMPWRKLIYRAISTFIDDLFALIIRMPTMHRIACFRDDVVFLVYLWQRRCYREDRSRTFDEDGYELDAVDSLVDPNGESDTSDLASDDDTPLAIDENDSGSGAELVGKATATPVERRRKHGNDRGRGGVRVDSPAPRKRAVAT